MPTFNADQGSRFTSLDFTGVLKGAQTTISMDGRLHGWPGTVHGHHLHRAAVALDEGRGGLFARPHRRGQA